MAKCALLLHFFLFVTIVSVAIATRPKSGSSQLVSACSEALDDEIVNFCATDFLKGKEAEFTDFDWRKMSAAALSQASARALTIQKIVELMARNKNLPLFNRATLNICLQSVTKGADQLSKAVADFQSMGKVISEDGLSKVQVQVDDAKFNQGKCDELLEGQVSLSKLGQQVHDALTGSCIVSSFLFHVRT